MTPSARRIGTLDERQREPRPDRRPAAGDRSGRGRPRARRGPNRRASSAGSCTSNHKAIGLRYIVTAFMFFCLAGILALLMRLQLSRAEQHVPRARTSTTRSSPCTAPR